MFKTEQWIVKKQRLQRKGFKNPIKNQRRLLGKFFLQ